MKPTIRIRPFTTSDLPAVLRIERASYSTPWPEASFKGLLGRIDTALFVAEAVESSDDGGEAGRSATPPEVVGYAVSWSVAGQGELGNIAVAPAWRRRGVARELLERVIMTMRGRDVHELYLEVRTSNEIAQRLYQSYGFREVGIRKAYYTNPTEDAIVMRLDI